MVYYIKINVIVQLSALFDFEKKTRQTMYSKPVITWYFHCQEFNEVSISVHSHLLKQTTTRDLAAAYLTAHRELETSLM